LLAGLEASGFPSPATSVVEVGIAYATRLLARTPGDLAVPFVVVAATPPFQNRAGVLLPVEGSRWILTLGGYHGDVPPTDDEGFLDFARSLPTPVIADLVETAEHLSPVMTHRFSSSRRRHFERLRTLPTRFVALGDALASFNPIYGQGMSSAALQADALARVVARNGLDGRATPRRFYRQAARAVDTAWKIAVGSDFMHPATRGPKRPGTDLINRYVGLVQRATHGSPAVLADMLAVQNLLASPRSLIRPSTVARVLLAARRSPAEPASSQLQPAGV
jgi:2-polyprenyl-6-methoxyphenol hydroxylase-like FAD-dependent oxidoreductase